MIGIENVLETFTWMMFLTSLAVFVIVLLRFLPNREEREDVTLWERIRLLIIILPLLYLFFNFTDSANNLSSFLFVDTLPIIIVMIFTLGLIELNIPFLSAVKDQTGKDTQRMIKKVRKR